jgi:hypothetical protein
LFTVLKILFKFLKKIFFHQYNVMYVCVIVTTLLVSNPTKYSTFEKISIYKNRSNYYNEMQNNTI